MQDRAQLVGSVEMIGEDLNPLTKRALAIRMEGERADLIAALEQEVGRVFACVTERAGDDDRGALALRVWIRSQHSSRNTAPDCASSVIMKPQLPQVALSSLPIRRSDLPMSAVTVRRDDYHSHFGLQITE